MKTTFLENLGSLDDYGARVNATRRGLVAPQHNAFLSPALSSEAFLALPSGLQPGTVVESAELKLTRMVHYTMQGNEPATLVVEQVEVDAGVDAADVSRLKLGVHLGRVKLWGWNEPGLARNAVLTVALGSFTIKDGTAFRLRLIPPSSGQRWDMFSAEPLLCALAYTVAEAAPPAELQDPFEAILVNMGMSAEQARQFVLAIRGGR